MRCLVHLQIQLDIHRHLQVGTDQVYLVVPCDMWSHDNHLETNEKERRHGPVRIETNTHFG